MRFVILIFIFNSGIAVAGPKSGYNLDGSERAEYCAKSVEGFYNEGTIGEGLWTSFFFWQDKYNPFIALMRGSYNPTYQLDMIKRMNPTRFKRCQTTMSLPVANASGDCVEKISKVSAENPVGDLNREYCFLKTPDSKNDFLRSGFDVPAEFVSAFSKKAVAEVQDNSTVTAILESRDFFREINIEADQVWNELLRCDGGAEGARVAFVANNSSCPDLNDRMSTFKINFYNSLMSAEPVVSAFDSSHIPGLTYVDNRLHYRYFDSSYQDSIADTSGSVLREHYRLMKMAMEKNPKATIHPLISQMALQLLIKIYRTDSSNSFFNRDVLTKNLAVGYVNLFKNLINIVLTVNNNAGIPMGLYPNAGWAAWSAMRERVVLARERLKPGWQGATEHKERVLETYFRLFYIEFNPNYGVITSNIQPVNLPEIYFEHGGKILEQFDEIDPVFNSLKIQADKK